MEAPAVTCNKCRLILEYYRHDIAAITGVPAGKVDVDAIIKRHSLQPTNSWRLESPRNSSKILKSTYQCKADPEHHWVTNHYEEAEASVKVIGG